MNRIASQFGIAAALTLGSLATAAAQTRTTPPTKTVPLTKTESKGEVVTVHDTVMVHDTVVGPTVYRRDTLTVTGPTVTVHDTTTLIQTPGWLARGAGLYFGLGAGSYYPSAGIGGGQIPGYNFQMNLGVDPAGSPFGIRLTGNLDRPDEAQPTGTLGGRPEVVNVAADLKLRMPFFSRAKFPMLGIYALGGGNWNAFKDLRQEDQGHNVVLEDSNWHHAFGWEAGAGVSANLGHGREAFVEGRFLRFKDDNFESAHQWPFVVGINWY
jgi:opacity protein-like surface antigen